MSVCILQNLEKYRVLWTDFTASYGEINWFSVSKIGPEPAKPTISLALRYRYLSLIHTVGVLQFLPLHNMVGNLDNLSHRLCTLNLTGTFVARKAQKP